MVSFNKEDMIEVAIVIPVYRPIPSQAEINSLKQCIHILANYPIVFVAPKGLDLSFYMPYVEKHGNVTTIFFSPSYFQSVTGYSKLLVSKIFYKQFTNYSYILIHQLDAWVFRDELKKWCALAEDYIGAPWLDAPPNTSGKKPIINFSNRLVKKVGNGGFSLRKVESHLKWATWASIIFKFIPKNEDIIWTLFVPFKKPCYLQALAFAFEMNPEQSFALNNNQLPFGCHAWEKYNPEFWNVYIPETTST